MGRLIWVWIVAGLCTCYPLADVWARQASREPCAKSNDKPTAQNKDQPENKSETEQPGSATSKCEIKDRLAFLQCKLNEYWNSFCYHWNNVTWQMALVAFLVFLFITLFLLKTDPPDVVANHDNATAGRVLRHAIVGIIVAAVVLFAWLAVDIPMWIHSLRLVHPWLVVVLPVVVLPVVVLPVVVLLVVVLLVVVLASPALDYALAQLYKVLQWCGLVGLVFFPVTLLWKPLRYRVVRLGQWSYQIALRLKRLFDELDPQREKFFDQIAYVRKGLFEWSTYALFSPFPEITNPFSFPSDLPIIIGHRKRIEKIERLLRMDDRTGPEMFVLSAPPRNGKTILLGRFYRYARKSGLIVAQANVREYLDNAELHAFEVHIRDQLAQQEAAIRHQSLVRQVVGFVRRIDTLWVKVRPMSEGDPCEHRAATELAEEMKRRAIQYDADPLVPHRVKGIAILLDVSSIQRDDTRRTSVWFVLKTIRDALTLINARNVVIGVACNHGDRNQDDPANCDEKRSYLSLAMRCEFSTDRVFRDIDTVTEELNDELEKRGYDVKFDAGFISAMAEIARGDPGNEALLWRNVLSHFWENRTS